MENKTYIKLILICIIIMVIFSSYNIISLKYEIRELKERQVNDKNCYDYFSNNENLIILHVDETENYCSYLLGE